MLTALSENVSAHVILLRAEAPIPEKTRLSLAIVVKPASSTKATRLADIERVLRAERYRTNGFVMAVWCSRPFRMTHPDSRDD